MGVAIAVFLLGFAVGIIAGANYVLAVIDNK